MINLSVSKVSSEGLYIIRVYSVFCFWKAVLKVCNVGGSFIAVSSEVGLCVVKVEFLEILPSVVFFVVEAVVVDIDESCGGYLALRYTV